jgi:prepilin-type N-terminal cleavage/methylation domain-containing protein
MTNRRTTNKRTAAQGFTLLELLTVMAIMFLIMGITVASYLGNVRGAALRGGLDNLHKMLSLARQHALTYRSRTYVVFDQHDAAMGGTRSGYRIVAQEGVHVGGAGANLEVGAPLWEEGQLAGGTVYNLTDGSSAEVVNNSTNFLTGTLSGGSLNQWEYGDRYGWILHDAEYLPTTLMFTDEDGNKDVPETIVFLPDGTTEKKTGEYTVHVSEIQGTEPARFSVSVQGLTGLIKRSDQD